MKRKTVLYVIISFLISFTALYAFEIFAQSYVNSFRLENEVYSKTFDSNQKIILILGSSEVAPLNATYINEHISKKGYNYSTFNLAIASDVPTERLATIEKIISMRPKVVFYGVGYRDFANRSLMPTDIGKTHGPLPDPQAEFKIFLDSNLKLYFPHLESPKYVTEKVLGELMAKDHSTYSQNIQVQTNTPFYSYTNEMSQIKNDSQIYFHYKQFPPLDYIESYDSNEEALALEKIIKKFRDNNVDIVIFTTPYNKIFFEDLDKHNRDTFNSILTTLTQKSGVKVIHLEQKYANLEIWQDYHHVSTNQHALIFTQDIVQSIESEIECCLTQ